MSFEDDGAKKEGKKKQALDDGAALLYAQQVLHFGGRGRERKIKES